VERALAPRKMGRANRAGALFDLSNGDEIQFDDPTPGTNYDHEQLKGAFHGRKSSTMPNDKVLSRR